MERIIEQIGGRPPKGVDLRQYIQGFEIWENFLKDLDEDLVIVSGCELTPVGIDISAGVVWFQDQLCIFEGVSSISLPYKVEKTESESDPRVFFDEVTRNTLKTVKIEGNTGGAGQIDTTTPRLSDYLTLNSDKYVSKTIAIGTYDMTSGAKTIALSLTASELLSIKNMSATITGDDTDYRYSDNFGVLLNINVSDLIITPGTFFDTSGFSGTVVDRGTVSFEYIKD